MYSIPNKVWQFVRLCPFSSARWWAKKDSLCVKNIENADKPKSAIAMLPPRPCRVSGNLPHTAFSSSSREGSSSILILNHFLLRLRILKTHFPQKIMQPQQFAYPPPLPPTHCRDSAFQITP